MAEPSGKIFVVDDNASFLSQLGNRLKAAGFQVFSSNSPLGMQKLALKTEPDLFLISLDMAALRGDRLVQLLKKQLPFRDVPTVLYGGGSKETLQQLAKEAGAEGYVRKENEIQDMIAYVMVVFRSYSLARSVKGVRDTLSGGYK